MNDIDALKLYMSQKIDAVELRQNLSPDAWKSFLDGALLATKHALEGYPPDFDPMSLGSSGLLGYTMGYLDTDQDVSPGI